MPYHALFDLDLALALKEQLVGAFDELDLGPFDDKSIGQVKKDQGVYKLFYKGTLVYVGKAENLPRRLSEHLTKIKGRVNISPKDMGFKCLYVGKNWTTLAPEEALIKYFKAQGEGQCEWNGNGFGPHDPGRERETTDKPAEGFDAMYPIRKDWACDWIDAGDWNVLKLIVSLKNNLPFLLRYQTGGKKGHYTKGHPDQRAAKVTIPKKGMPADQLLSLVAKAMPGWQATCFPGCMILYKESKKYSYGVKL
jgi:hypothetical protein